MWDADASAHDSQVRHLPQPEQRGACCATSRSASPTSARPRSAPPSAPTSRCRRHPTVARRRPTPVAPGDAGGSGDARRGHRWCRGQRRQRRTGGGGSGGSGGASGGSGGSGGSSSGGTGGSGSWRFGGGRPARAGRAVRRATDARVDNAAPDRNALRRRRPAAPARLAGAAGRSGWRHESDSAGRRRRRRRSPITAPALR